MTMSHACVQIESLAEDAPCVHTRTLDTLWFQVAGTICNIRCHHCFIRCAPDNDKFGFMSYEDCAKHLEASRPLGVREFYFTGGEPFANPAMCDILEHATRLGPCTVLTNAMLLRDGVLDRLVRIAQASEHALEFRVSLDGYTAEMNDPIRGEGTFDATLDGTRRLVERGFSPIITMTRTWCGDDRAVLAGFVTLLGTIGYANPRLKILPLLKLGAEVDRGGAYGPEAFVTREMMQGYDESRLLCKTARLVTDRGVWVCPILLDSPAARMGDTIEETIRDYPLGHQACRTCWQHGAICSNDTTCAERKPCA
jgi:uncharacterized Fe-S cluster-containing radical SAM superfamily protein